MLIRGAGGGVYLDFNTAKLFPHFHYLCKANSQLALASYFLIRAVTN